MTLGDKLPDELTVEILRRLPSKSLLRYKSVAKPWQKLLKNRHFIQTHAQTRSSTTRCLIKLSRNDTPVLSVLDIGYPNVSLNDLKVGNFGTLDTARFVISAYCDGLVCLSYESGDVFVWNPATREIRHLPDGGKVCKGGYKGGQSYYGLGFDEKLGDYKVVKVWTVHNKGINRYKTRAAVIGLRDSKCRLVWPEPELEDISCLGKPLRCGGKLYFRAVHYVPSRYFLDALLVFDLWEEGFEVIMLPSPTSVDIPTCTNTWGRVVELGDSVGLVSPSMKTNRGCFEIWKVCAGGVGGKCSLSRYMTIETSLINPKVLFVTRDGEFLLEGDGRNVFLYNVNTDEMKNLEIKVCDDQVLYAYSESLVSAKGEVDGADRCF